MTAKQPLNFKFISWSYIFSSCLNAQSRKGSRVVMGQGRWLRQTQGCEETSKAMGAESL